MPRDIQGEVLTAIMEYGLNGVTTENLKPVAKAIFALIRPQLDANNKRFLNGKSGGRPLKETEQKPNDNQNETKQEANVNDNVNVNANVNENDINTPNGVVDFQSTDDKNSFSDELAKQKYNYKSLAKDKKTIFEFLSGRPQFAEPYFDFWNLFAVESGKSKATKLSDKRVKKIRVRIKDPDFDIGNIIRKARTSELLMTSNWFDFDWIIENDSNYLHVLEGRYDNEKVKNKNGHTDTDSTAKEVSKWQANAERQRQLVEENRQ